MTRLVSYPVIVEPYGRGFGDIHPTVPRYHIFFPDLPINYLGVDEFDIFGLGEALRKAEENLNTFFTLYPNRHPKPSKVEDIERYYKKCKPDSMVFPIVITLKS